jgi:hypothetical protein
VNRKKKDGTQQAAGFGAAPNAFGGFGAPAAQPAFGASQGAFGQPQGGFGQVCMSYGA